MKVVAKIMLLGLILHQLSCTKEVLHNGNVGDVNHGGFVDQKEMEIVLEQPLECDTVSFGQVLNIQGSIVANFNLHGYSIRVYNATTNELIWHRNKHTHGDIIVFSESWTNSLSSDTPLLLEILAVGNHEGTMDMFKRVSLFAKST